MIEHSLYAMAAAENNQELSLPSISYKTSPIQLYFYWSMDIILSCVHGSPTETCEHRTALCVSYGRLFRS